MKLLILFTVLITIYKSASLLTGFYDQNSTNLIEDKQAIKEVDVLRQIINQETIIRLTMVKDMDSLKQSMESMESTLASLRENSNNIYKELNKSKSQTIEKDNLRSCEKEWANYQGDCYYFSKSAASFLDAMGVCHLMDADMIVLQNAEEEKWLDLQFRLRGYSNDSQVWLGVSDIQEEGTFISVSNAEGLRYSHWARGQPDSYGGEEDCVTYCMPEKGMNDVPCNFKYNYVCKTNILKKMLTLSTSKRNTCNVNV